MIFHMRMKITEVEMVLVSKKNRKILLYIVAVVASIFLLVGLIVILSTNDHGKKQEGKIGKNNYKIVSNNINIKDMNQ